MHKFFLLLLLISGAVMTAEAARVKHQVRSKEEKKVEAAGATLHLFKQMSAVRLCHDGGGWSQGDQGLCMGQGYPEIQHKTMTDAPAVAREVAERLNEALDGATLPASESDIDGRVIVISNLPAHVLRTTTKKACLEALAIVKEIIIMTPQESRDGRAQLEDVWGMATLGKKDWSKRQQFCYTDVELPTSGSTEEEENSAKIAMATKIMGESLTDHFEFNFEDGITTAPVIYGGYAADGSIVGVLGMRVWT